MIGVLFPSGSIELGNLAGVQVWFCELWVAAPADFELNGDGLCVLVVIDNTVPD
jgi:hypothetical protein